MTPDLVGAIFRGLLGLVMVTTPPVLLIAGIEVPEPVWAMVGLPVGYWFGQRGTK